MMSKQNPARFLGLQCRRAWPVDPCPTTFRPRLRAGCWPSRTSSGDSAGEKSEPARDDCVLHRLRHRHRMLGACDGGVHQHAVGAQFHRERGIRRRADAGIHDHRHLRELADDPDVVGVLNAETGADRRAERHHRRCACVFELAARDRIVVGVWQDDEAFLDQDARRFDERFVVGKERPLVADDLELHPIRQAGFASQPRRANRVVGRVAAGGVRQDEDALASM